MWANVIGQLRPFTRIEAIHSKRGVTYYVSKYIAKAGDKNEDGTYGFNYVPYSATPSNSTETGQDVAIGRFWGIEHIANIVWCKATWWTVATNSTQFIMRLKCQIAKYYDKLSLLDSNGFCYFCDDAERWRILIDNLLKKEVHVCHQQTKLSCYSAERLARLFSPLVSSSLSGAT